MSDGLHPLAPHALPSFITAPGEPDVLFNVMIVVVVAALLIVGSLYLQLHSLPERMAHRTNRVQLEIVAVLCLLALFTHQHLFWIAALLLALVQIPDFSTPLIRIAESLERLGAGATRPVADAAARPGSGEAGWVETGGVETGGVETGGVETGDPQAVTTAGPRITQAG